MKESVRVVFKHVGSTWLKSESNSYFDLGSNLKSNNVWNPLQNMTATSLKYENIINTLNQLFLASNTFHHLFFLFLSNVISNLLIICFVNTSHERVVEEIIS